MSVLSLATLVITSTLVLAIVCTIDGVLLSSNLRRLLTFFARSNSLVSVKALAKQEGPKRLLRYILQIIPVFFAADNRFKL